MVLQAAYTVVTHILPSGYYWHIVVSVVVLVITYAFSQGRTTSRERDLHARTILVTVRLESDVRTFSFKSLSQGAFSPLGMTLVSNLASRGAHIVALSPYPLEHPQPALLIPALRDETKNPNIYAEYADLASPVSIREFCTKFLTGDDQRLDAIVFAHEYASIGSIFGSKAQEQLNDNRDVASLATFLLTTLLLPALLVAPVERDIRILHLVNPFYAAASANFTNDLLASMSTTPAATHSRKSLFLTEGYRSLRTAVLARHLQRILNALPNRAPTLDPKYAGSVPPGTEQPAKSEKKREDAHKFPSNIVAVSVCPGVSRSDIVRSVLGLEADDRSLFLLLLYVLLEQLKNCVIHPIFYRYLLIYPVVWLFAKSSDMAMQTVFHSLFLPTPFKRALAQLAAVTDPSSPEAAALAQAALDPDTITEVVKPGALYRECSVVALNFAPLPEATKDDATNEKTKGKAANKEETKGLEEFALEDDGEYGGEGVGRVVWEWYETRLKTWEAKFTEQKSD